LFQRSCQRQNCPQVLKRGRATLLLRSFLRGSLHESLHESPSDHQFREPPRYSPCRSFLTFSALPFIESVRNGAQELPTSAVIMGRRGTISNARASTESVVKPKEYSVIWGCKANDSKQKALLNQPPV